MTGARRQRLVAVVCPMGAEYRFLVSSLDDAGPEQDVAGRRVVLGRIGTTQVLVCRSGWGKTMAASTCQLLIDRWRPALVLDTGTAGAIRRGMAVGDLLVAERVTDGDLAASAQLAKYATLAAAGGAADQGPPGGLARWLSRLAGTPLRSARLVCMDRTVASSADRARLEARGFDAVCWEAFSIVKVAQANDTPSFSLRVVSDLADESVVDTFWSHLEDFMAKLSEVVREILPRLDFGEVEERCRWVPEKVETEA